MRVLLFLKKNLFDFYYLFFFLSLFLTDNDLTLTTSVTEETQMDFGRWAKSLNSLRMAERLSILMGQQKQQHDIPSCVILFFLLLFLRRRYCYYYILSLLYLAGVKCVKHSHIRCRSQADWISVCFQLHLLVKIFTILFLFFFFSHSFIHSGFSIFYFRRGILHVLAWREVAQFFDS